MRKLVLPLLLLLLLLLSVITSAQTFNVTIGSSSATNIVTTAGANMVVVYQNSTNPTASYTVTDPYNSPSASINVPAGGVYTFVGRQQAGYSSGTTVGTVQATTGSGYTFIVIQSFVVNSSTTFVNAATNPVSVGPGSSGTAVSSTTVCVPGSYAAQTDGATVTWAIGSNMCANASLLFTTNGGSRTLNLTGMVNGRSYILKLTQNGTGGEGLTLGSGCAWKVSGGGSGAITPSSLAGAVDVLAWSYDGTNCLANFNTSFD